MRLTQCDGLCIQEEQDAVAWALKEGFWLAAQQWIAFLRGHGKINRLHDLLFALRKHFKMLRSAPEVFLQLITTGISEAAWQHQ